MNGKLPDWELKFLRCNRYDSTTDRPKNEEENFQSNKIIEKIEKVEKVEKANKQKYLHIFFSHFFHSFLPSLVEFIPPSHSKSSLNQFPYYM